MLEWLTKYEPIWLFVILFGELLVGLYSAWILTVEFWYDKDFNENIRKSRRDKRRKQFEFEKLCIGEHQ